MENWPGTARELDPVEGGYSEGGAAGLIMELLKHNPNLGKVRGQDEEQKE
jgi:hypothetical protein